MTENPEPQSGPSLPTIPPESGLPGWLLPMVIGLVTLVAFFPPLIEKEFLSMGDHALLKENTGYRGLGPRNIQWAFGAYDSGHYQPLVWLSYGLDRAIWKEDARGYYLTNLVLHGLSAVFLFFIVGRLFMAARTGRPASPAPGDRAAQLAAAATALFFAVHPLRAESVVWATQRRDVLCGFFFLASVLAYICCRDAGMPPSEQDDSPARPGAARLWLVASVLLGLCAILSKATAAALPLVLLVLDFYPLRAAARRVKGIWLDRVPFFILGGICVMNALQAIQDVNVSPGPESFGVRLGIALQGTFALLLKTVAPTNLAPVYDLRASAALTDPGVLASLFGAVAMTVFLVRLRKRRPIGLAVWLCYLFLLLPVSGLVPIGVPVEADRNSYLSCIGWAMLLGAGLWSLWRKREPGSSAGPAGAAGAGAAVIVLVLLAGLTFRQTGFWRSEESLWTRVLECNPENYMAYAHLGAAMQDKGDLEKAEQMYRRATEIEPGAWDVHNNLGRVLSVQGRYEDGVEHFRRAREINPTQVAPRQNLATNLFLLGRPDEAFAELREMLSLLPSEEPDESPTLKSVRARIYNDLGVIHFGRREYDQAIEFLSRALDIQPLFPEAHQTLGDCWQAKGEISLAEGKISQAKGETNQAIAHLKEALRLKPNDELVRRKLSELLSRTQPGGAGAPAAGGPPTGAPATDGLQSRIARAMQQMREALSEDPNNVAAHNDLGNLLVRIGRLDEGIRHYQEALKQEAAPARVHYNLVRVLMNHQRHAQAVAAAREGLSKFPNETMLLGALAWMLATTPDEDVRNPEDALKLAEQANRLDPGNPSLLEALAAAQAANDRLDEAIATIDKAARTVESEGPASMADRLATHRKTYEARRAAQQAP